MKRIIVLLAIMGYAVSGYAQDAPKRVFLGINMKTGKNSERMTLMPTNWIYPDAVNNSATEPEIDNENFYGFDAQIGVYFGKKAKWGLSTGLVYLKNDGTVTLDRIHFEYRSTDFNGDTYRQVVSNTKALVESIQTTNMSIPLLLKYRTMFSKSFGLVVDAGLLYNVKMESSYTGASAFNYEAIYKFVPSGDAYVAVYDESPHPDENSWLITVDEYQANVGDGNEAAYFKTLQDQGYNVGLNEAAAGSGTVTHKTGSLGIMIQPMLSFKLNETFSLNVGPYWSTQTFHNSQSNLKSRVTDKIGQYNSILNNAVNRRQDNYGATIGLSLHF